VDIADAAGIGVDRVFVVPGNHDVQRSADQAKSVLRLLQSLRTYGENLDDVLTDPVDRDRLFARFAHYIEFSAEFAPACLSPATKPEERLSWTHRLSARGGLVVRMVGLNTALLAADDADRGKLQLGTKQITQAITEPALGANEVVVVLSHHTLDGGWLADQKHVLPWVQNYGHVHLFGHIHDAREDRRVVGPGDRLIRISAGAFTYNVCAIVRRADGSTVLSVWPRRWSMNSKAFVADVEQLSAGHVVVECPLPIRLDASSPGPASPGALPAVHSLDGALFEGPSGVPVRPVPVFVGRRAELSALADILVGSNEDRGTCVLVTGLGGIGKTALVQQFVNSAVARESFPDGGVWLDGADLAAGLARVVRRFGWKQHRQPTVEEANAWLGGALPTRRVLVVIDNADAVPWRDLPIPGGQCRTIITSRGGLPEDVRASVLPVGSLDHASCRIVLENAVPGLMPLAIEKLDFIADITAGHPLSLQMIAGALRSNDVLRASFLRGEIHLFGSGVDALRRIEAGLFANLSAREKNVLIALASCATATRTQVVAHVAGIPAETTASCLNDLAERSIVNRDDRQTRPWGLNDAVRELLRKQEGAEEARAAHRRYLESLFATQDEPAGREALEEDIVEVLTTVDRSIEDGNGEEALDVLDQSHAFLLRVGRIRDLINRYERILPLPLESHGKAAVLHRIGIYQRDAGNLDQAIKHLQLALEIDESLNSTEGQAACLDALGTCFHQKGELAMGLIYYTRALMIGQQVGLGEVAMRALGNLGICYRDLGNLQDAITSFERIVAIAQPLGLEEDQATAMENLAICYKRAGHPRRAIEVVQRALAIEERIGRKSGQAQAYETLGTSYREVGELLLALEMHSMALSIYMNIGYLHGQAIQLANLGGCYAELGERTQAIDFFERALECFERIGIPDDHPDVQRLRASITVATLSRDEQNFFYVTRAAVRDVRSIEDYVWEVSPEKSAGWHIILGENGSGKTSFLRSIALALIGPTDVMAYRPNFARWLRGDAENARVEVTLSRLLSAEAAYLESILTPAERLEPPAYPRHAALHLEIELRRDVKEVQRLDLRPKDRELWESSQDAFSAAYGPFRRFVGADIEYERAFADSPRLDRHVSLFDSNVALAEGLTWLSGLQTKRLAELPGGELLDPVVEHVNDPRPPPLLPHGARLDISDKTIRVVDGHGFPVPLEDLSDGYRSVLSLHLDIVRHLIDAFGKERVFSRDDPAVIVAGGIVLIDEVDAHLHPTWQRLIGVWFRKHFPNVQFIVTTHSPLVCHAADTVFVLPEPGSEDAAKMVEGVELDRLRYGNVLEAFGTGVFGRGVTRSDKSKEMLDRLVALNRKEVEDGLSPAEEAEQEHLRAILPMAAPLRHIPG
jgi:tetratricopeptide (TPR) repeat protein